MGPGWARMSPTSKPGWVRKAVKQSTSAGPKRGCLNVVAWKPQESGRKAPLSCNAAFSMLQCSFSFVAAQLLVQMTSLLQKRQCCSAVPAAQRSENCSATSVFACGMLQGWGLEGSGLGLAEHMANLDVTLGHGEVRVYRGTGVSRGVRRTTWERSLKNWELQISCFEEFLGGENVLGLVPASLPHTLGYACTFYAPTSPPPRPLRSRIGPGEGLDGAPQRQQRLRGLSEFCPSKVGCRTFAALLSSKRVIGWQPAVAYLTA